MRSRSLSDICVVLLAGIATIVAVDFALQRANPSPRLREAADGIRDLRESNPRIVVLGSSHARTFHVLGQELTHRSGESNALVAIPLESGKLAAYRWVFEHRILPLIDERDMSGRRVRNRIDDFILVTEWWDTCSNGSGPTTYWNLPARAWTWRDYFSDVHAHGVDTYNRNYVRDLLRRDLGWFDMVHWHGTAKLPRAVIHKVTGRDPFEQDAKAYAAKLGEWHAMVENGVKCIGAPEQMAALDAILSELRDRNIATTVVLFPRKPDTITDKARATTIADFAAMARSAATAQGARLVDLTLSTPLTSADFMEDFDHVTPSGNAKFATWALDHDLSFLLAPSTGAGVEGSR